MQTEAQKESIAVFKIENCRAKPSAEDLVDCLSPEQSSICGFSTPFGNGYFCNHPHRNEFIEITKKLESQSAAVSNTDAQEAHSGL